MNTQNHHMTEIWDRDWFIRFFVSKPAELWCTGAWSENGQHCAMGFLQAEFKGGMKLTQYEHTVPAVHALAKLLFPAAYAQNEGFGIAAIAGLNDGSAWSPASQFHLGPRGRILNALRALPAPKNPIISVMIGDVPVPVPDQWLLVRESVQDWNMATIRDYKNQRTGEIRREMAPAYAAWGWGLGQVPDKAMTELAHAGTGDSPPW